MTTRLKDGKSKKDALSAKIYAQNAPKIFLETVTARTATLVLAVTYIAFIIGFTYDIVTVYQDFTTSDTVLKAKSCSTQNVSLSYSGLNSWGCTTGYIWEGFVPALSNIISVSLSLKQDNITSLIESKNNSKVAEFSLVYDLELWACYLPHGCHNSFSNIPEYSGSDWHKVIDLDSVAITWDRATITQQQYFEADLLGNTFQNQESIPAHGKVQSYYFKVQYVEDVENIFVGNDARMNSVVYTTHVLSYPTFYNASGAFSCVLMFIALTTLMGFLYAMALQKRKWLPEQKWICFYLVALILFINPFYCIIVWFQYVPIEAVFAFYLSDIISQAAFFVIWLLFADSYRRKSSSRMLFYGPKVFLGLAIFVMSLTMLVYQFPDIDGQGILNQRSAVLAVENWSIELKRTFIGVSVTLFVLVCIWGIWWLATLYLTGRALQQLPYMNTRYIQLSFRFFTLQAIMVALYFVFQIGAVIVYLLEYAAAGITSSTDVSNIINTLTRQQTQMFGKVMFLSVYAIVMAFLFLPADMVDQSWATALASTFVVTEKEMRDTVKARKAAIKDLEHITAGVLSQVVHAKPEVFCVDIALNLCNISFEAYYDPEGVKTVSGYDTKPMELEKHGWKLVDVHYNPQHETFCFIARHLYSKKMVVCFRGTSCQLHWNDNLNYKQRLLDIQSMNLPELDAEDGLDYDPPGHLRSRLEVLDELHTLQDGATTTGSNASSPRVERKRLFGFSAAGSAGGGGGGEAAADGNSNNEGGGGTKRNEAREEDSDSESDFSLNDEDMTMDISTRHVGFIAVPYGSPSSAPKREHMLSRNRGMSMSILGGGGGAPIQGVDRVDNPETFGGMLEMGGLGGTRPRLFSTGMSFGQSRSVLGGGGADSGDDANHLEEDDTHNKWAERIADHAATLGQNMNNAVNNAVDATSVVVGNAADIVANVASQTPGLKNIVQPHVHSGFFDAYSVVRPFVHRTLRRELSADPAHVYFAGHSLGGAIATIAAYDCSVHTIPRVQEYLDKKREAAIAENELSVSMVNQQTRSLRELGQQDHSDPRIILARHGRSISAPTIRLEPPPPPQQQSTPSSDTRDNVLSSSSIPTSAVGGGGSDFLTITPPRQLYPGSNTNNKNTANTVSVGKRQKIKVSMYNFGAPRVGNLSFALMYNRTIPDSFRVVIDGDIVTAVPPAGYRHIGTQALIDNLGAGSIIIDPSFVERRLRTHTKTSVSVHSLLIYRKGLKGVKDAVAYLRKYAESILLQSSKLDIDAAKLAVRAALIKNSQSKMTPTQEEPMTSLSGKNKREGGGGGGGGSSNDNDTLDSPGFTEDDLGVLPGSPSPLSSQKKNKSVSFTAAATTSTSNSGDNRAVAPVSEVGAAAQTVSAAAAVAAENKAVLVVNNGAVEVAEEVKSGDDDNNGEKRSTTVAEDVGLADINLLSSASSEEKKEKSSSGDHHPLSGAAIASLLHPDYTANGSSSSATATGAGEFIGARALELQEDTGTKREENVRQGEENVLHRGGGSVLNNYYDSGGIAAAGGGGAGGAGRGDSSGSGAADESAHHNSIDDIVALTLAFQEVQAEAKRDIEFEEAVHFANDVNNTAMLLQQIEHSGGVTPYYIRLASDIATDTVHTIGSLGYLATSMGGGGSGNGGSNNRRGSRVGRRDSGRHDQAAAASEHGGVDIDRGSDSRTHRSPERSSVSHRGEYKQPSIIDRAVKFVWGEEND